MSKSGSLLSEIERDLLNGAPVADVLRKLIVLGGHAGSSDLRDWASQELRGYGPGEDLPGYRRVQAAIQLDGIAGFNRITGQSIAPEHLPEEVGERITNEVPVRQGIGEIEALIIRGEADKHVVRFGLPGDQLIAQMMNDAFPHQPLPDSLHPDANLYAETGRRFAHFVFGEEGLVSRSMLGRFSRRTGA